jgi:hypothetical protein
MDTRITCPHCGTPRVTLAAGLLVEHHVPPTDVVRTVTRAAYGDVKLEVIPLCAWSNAKVVML